MRIAMRIKSFWGEAMAPAIAGGMRKRIGPTMGIMARIAEVRDVEMAKSICKIKSVRKVITPIMSPRKNWTRIKDAKVVFKVD